MVTIKDKNFAAVLDYSILEDWVDDEGVTHSPVDWDYEDHHNEYIQDFTEALKKINPEGLEYKIEGKNMRWTHVSGETIALDEEQVIEKLKFGSDYSIFVNEVKDGDTEITLMRYSHDEPTGASFTIKPFKPEDDGTETWPLKKRRLDSCTTRLEQAQLLVYFRKCK